MRHGIVVGTAGFLLGLVVGGGVTAALRPVPAPAAPSAAGWTLWRQTMANRQLGHVKVQDFADQPTCLTALKPKVAEGQSAWPMIYLSIDGQTPGWLGCFPTVGYEPDRYK